MKRKAYSKSRDRRSWRRTLSSIIGIEDREEERDTTEQKKKKE